MKVEGFMIISPRTLFETLDNMKANRQARDKLCLEAERNRVSWGEVLEICERVCGKREGLSLGESKKVIEEIKRRGR